MVDLLQVKWKSFVKREFFIQMILYTIFFCFASSLACCFSLSAPHFSLAASSVLHQPPVSQVC